MVQVFCDSDGVLAAFDDNVLRFFGKKPRQFSNAQDMWDLINAEPSFWPAIEVRPNAMRLWTVLKPYNPIIITGCPKGNFEDAAAHKVDFLSKHFGPVKVITCLARDKQDHMLAKGDILIDDFKSNVKRWVEAGGIGVHYRNCNQAIEDFQILMSRLSQYNV